MGLIPDVQVVEPPQRVHTSRQQCGSMRRQSVRLTRCQHRPVKPYFGRAVVNIRGGGVQKLVFQF